MSITPGLVASLRGLNTARMLESWDWLLPQLARPWIATALGDLFLIGSDGRVWWLSLADGDLHPVATTPMLFLRAADEPAARERWFGVATLDQLGRSGYPLEPGDCYSYGRLPLLGGVVEPANFLRRRLVDHFSVWGSVVEQLVDPPGGPPSPGRSVRRARRCGVTEPELLVLRVVAYATPLPVHRMAGWAAKEHHFLTDHPWSRLDLELAVEACLDKGWLRVLTKRCVNRPPPSYSTYARYTTRSPGLMDFTPAGFELQGRIFGNAIRVRKTPDRLPAIGQIPLVG